MNEVNSVFPIMLLTVQNLIEYLNSKYFKDVKIEEEVKRMTKTLYDPEVERKGEEKKAMEIAKNFLKLGVDIDKIIKGTGLSENIVKELSKEVKY